MPTSLPARKNAQSSAALLTAGILMGTAGLASSLLADVAGAHALTIAMYRLLLSGVITVAFVWVIGRLREVPRNRNTARRILLTGFLLASLQASFFAAVVLMSVGIATMVTIGSVPVFVAIATVIMRPHRLERRMVISVFSGLFGLVLLTWSPNIDAEPWRMAAGVVLALLAGFGFATLTMVNRTPIAGLDSLSTTALGCFAGGLMLLPAAVGVGVTIPLRTDSVLLVVYLAVVPTALAYVAYFYGLRGTHPLLAALAALLEPLTAAFLAALVLGESLGGLGWCGAALLVTGLAVSYSVGGSGHDQDARPNVRNELPVAHYETRWPSSKPSSTM